MSLLLVSNTFPDQSSHIMSRWHHLQTNTHVPQPSTPHIRCEPAFHNTFVDLPCWIDLLQHSTLLRIMCRASNQSTLMKKCKVALQIWHHFIATCIASPLVKRTLVLSLDAPLTLLGKIELWAPSAISSMIASFRSSRNVRAGLACRKTPITRASTRPRAAWLTYTFS
jgi:hypothetical protein